MASEAGNASIVVALIQNHIDFDACNVDGDNALHVAVRAGHLNVVCSVVSLNFFYTKLQILG